MFTQPISSPPPGPETSTPPVPVSPARPSRLRGLSYLRNYTHNHLLSRDSHHATSSPARAAAAGASLSRSASYSPVSAPLQPPVSIAPSASLAAASASSAASHNPHRLTLVNSTPFDARALQRPLPTSVPKPIPETSSVKAGVSQPRNGLAATSDDGSDDDSGQQHQTPIDMTRSRASTTADAAGCGPDATPSIRLSAYYDPRSTRPSLSFPPISRTLSTPSDVIRVGRYSERDGQVTAAMPGNQSSAAPVGFKSKVVSRRHCEFWYEDGKWYIRDVKSSSGTFLNHIRLSPPTQESKAYPVNDGDIVQLGIDFKGGEEMIFRCVKMRLELNRGWQNKLNTFNLAAHKRLRSMASTAAAAASVSGSNSQDCSICLNSIAPCQSLFVAPCSHTWHFKCVRSLLTSPQYPIFVCPNCRAGADLEADVEEPSGEWQQLEDCPDEQGGKTEPAHEQRPEAVPDPADVTVQDADAMDLTVSVGASDSPADRSTLPHAASDPLPIANPASGAGRVNHLRENRSPSPSTNGEGPITPRNNAGPWVFDGSAGRRAADAASGMRSLDAAAAELDLGGGPVPSDDSSRSS